MLRRGSRSGRVEELRVFAGDDELIRDIYERCHEQSREDIDSQCREPDSIATVLKGDHAEITHLVATAAGPDLIETTQVRIDKNEARLKELRETIDNHRPIRVSHVSIRKTLGKLDKAWDKQRRLFAKLAGSADRTDQ